MVPSDTSFTALSPFTPHWDLYPKSYVAQKISFPLIDHIDGDLNKDIWLDVPWSDYFDDIRGQKDAPDDEHPNDSCRTRFKALWDDTHIYIGAILESDFETKATFTERNSPIYQKDSDFEVFIDPFGSCHNYKELEVNAINTIWNLMLDRPYADGGAEHSARIAHPGDDMYYEVYHQKTATKVLKGELNNPKVAATWSIEIAISYKDVLAHVTDDIRPMSVGTMWRINFSRVERSGDTNWTWCPQIVWSPKDKCPRGFVQMHLPDAWGYFVFGDKSLKRETAPLSPRDPTWPARLAAMNVYYAQKAYLEDKGEYASHISQLDGRIDAAIVAPFEIYIGPRTGGEIHQQRFMVIVEGNLDGSVVSVTDDRFLQVHTAGTPTELS
jgi:Carbohydrate family 9 binding domain-like